MCMSLRYFFDKVKHILNCMYLQRVHNCLLLRLVAIEYFQKLSLEMHNFGSRIVLQRNTENLLFTFFSWVIEPKQLPGLLHIINSNVNNMLIFSYCCMNKTPCTNWLIMMKYWYYF